MPRLTIAQREEIRRKYGLNPTQRQIIQLANDFGLDDDDMRSLFYISTPVPEYDVVSALDPDPDKYC